ncbi:hypothetical protein [Paraburkholderia phosphatilytica]|uniref:hypothetical protein n=1 Tax=Paraburkholderia phosphatilytica TaxID=2282883 RepID=UPI000E4E35ED|nr:hypothetical protein [Paraburkholderia phosphatilytica]
MATFAIDGVRISPSTDRVTHVRWGPIDAKSHDWLSPPQISDIDAVVQAIHAGEIVWSVYTLGGRRYLGPKIKAVAHMAGLDGIDTDVPDGHVEKCIDDLPRV